MLTGGSDWENRLRMRAIDAVFTAPANGKEIPLRLLEKLEEGAAPADRSQRLKRSQTKLPRPAGLRSTTRRRSVAEASTPHRRFIDGDQGSRIKEGQGSRTGRIPPSPQGGVDQESVAWLEMLNREAGRHFRPVEENLRPVRARLRAGFTFEQAEVVVRDRVREWRGTAQDQYLRPTTVFGTKFDSYLQASRNGGGQRLTPKTQGNLQAAREFAARGPAVAP